MTQRNADPSGGSIGHSERCDDPSSTLATSVGKIARQAERVKRLCDWQQGADLLVLHQKRDLDSICMGIRAEWRRRGGGSCVPHLEIQLEYLTGCPTRFSTTFLASPTRARLTRLELPAYPPAAPSGTAASSCMP